MANYHLGMEPSAFDGAAPPVLHELEQEVMDEVWRLGQTPVRDVLDALNARSDKPRAYTTIMTIMTRLHDKGLLDRTRVGKSHVYEPTMSSDEYADARASAQVEALVDEWGEVALVHFAKEMSRLDPKRRRQVAQRAKRA